jgi:outer membrane protein OmpA-like peptidoglycan-associated protein
MAAAALACGAQAQEAGHSNYIGINIGGGLQGMACSPAQGDHTLGLGLGAGVHYAHFFGPHFGLGFGVRYASAASSTLYNFTESTADLTHSSNPGVRYDLNTTFDHWREHQRLGFVSVPVELFWRVPMGSAWALMVGVGAQADFNVGGTYRADEGTYTTTGHFHAIGHRVQDLPQHGFSTYDADFESDIDRLPVGVSLLADLGVRRALGHAWGLYLGLYGTYGLSNLAGESTEPLVNIGSGDASQMDYNGTFGSSQIDVLRLVGVGVKVGLDFGWSCAAAQPAKEEPVLVQREEPQPAESARREQQEVQDQQERQQAAARAAAERDAARRAAEQAQAQKATARAEAIRRIEGMTIAFDFGVSEPKMSTEDDLALRAICTAMREDPSVKVLLVGHTDDIGSAESNLQLGQERAEAVRRRMVELGAPATSIATSSRGEEQPVATNATDEGRARNRRVEVLVEG